MLDFLIISGSILFGIICSVFINRYLTTKKDNKFKLSEDTKSELNNFVFEKSVALEALNKINQFFGEKKIDEYEKDRLLIKYGKLLDHYDERIFKLQPILEVQEIYEYRKQLHSLISDSIVKLDEKLNNFSNKFNYSKEDSNSKPDLRSVPIIKKITDNDKSIIPNNDDNNDNNDNNDHLLSHDKNQIDLNLQNGNENSLTFSSIIENHIDDIKKDDLGDLNMEEINKIQKDVLKILKRLDTSFDKI
jgi:hypothetical protein